MGLMLGCFVSATNAADGKAAPVVLVPVLEVYQRIEKVLADQGYRSAELAQQVETAYKCVVEVAQRNGKGKGFTPEPFRWIVERTFAWIDNARILCP